jgi:acetylornithine deacetylase/succinyl-diaminopimelate desuccinylase-like protein
LRPDAIREVVSHISAQEAGDLTYELVQIPSVTGEEGAAADYYAECLRGLGLDVRLQYVEPGRPNVIGRLAGRGGGENLLLYGHLDTIPWTGCVPPRRDPAVVWGRGAADMKGSLIAMALAAKALREAGVPLKGDLYLAGSPGHEIPWPLHPTLGHGDGAKLLAQSIRAGELPVDACVITEGPTDGIFVAQGSVTPWRITIEGGAGAVHTSTTTLDHSPVTWLGELLADLYAYNKEIQKRGEYPLLGKPPRLEIGLVSGGDYFNRNPATATAIGAIRWDPDWTAERAEAEFRARLAATRARLVEKYQDDSIRIDLFFRVGKDAIDTREHPDTRRLIEQLQAAARPVLGQELVETGARAATDLEIFCRQGGIATVAFGPGVIPSGTIASGQPGGAHSDEEGIAVASIVRVAGVCAALAMETCGVED